MRTWLFPRKVSENDSCLQRRRNVVNFDEMIDANSTASFSAPRASVETLNRACTTAANSVRFECNLAGCLFGTKTTPCLFITRAEMFLHKPQN